MQRTRCLMLSLYLIVALFGFLPALMMARLTGPSQASYVSPLVLGSAGRSSEAVGDGVSPCLAGERRLAG